MAKKSVKTHEMSALRMPGFNAEASLYTSPVTYHTAGGSGGPIGAVQPAQGNPCLVRCEQQCRHQPYFQYCVRRCFYENCE